MAKEEDRNQKNNAEKIPHQNVIQQDISSEMKESYLDYAMSVITSRALPDVRDGLKPVHRRILFTMHQMGLVASAKFRKSAAVIGDVMGKYHPHGDTALYDAMAKMAQNFSYRYPLVIGQGNFGGIDGDRPAAMRYTEAKMAKISEELLRDLEKETVKWRPNYDNTKKEPIVLPSAAPNILLNGTLGIAVGMATNIAPHNLTEVCNAAIELIDNKDAITEDLMKHIKGPDFPTGGIIFNHKDIHHAYSGGKGGVLTRGEAEIVEDKKENFSIIITSIPYSVNKSDLLIKIADLVKDKQLEETFHFNMVALVDGIPQTLSLKKILEEFISHRQIIVRRRTEFDLRKAQDREHILIGLKKALDHIDKIIKTIKASKDASSAHGALMKEFKFSDKQAEAILEMKLQKLAGLERKKIEDELKATQELIKNLKELLASPKKILTTIKNELKAIIEKYGDERRTKIMKSEAKLISEEDLVPDEESVLILTSGGYIKRTNPNEYKKQKRGGVGVIDLNTKEEDFVTTFLTANTHSDILFFSDRGKAYQMKMYNIPEGRRATRGKSIMNFLSLQQGENITSVLQFPKELKKDELSLMMVTKNGTAKKVSAENFYEVRKSGLLAITLSKNDKLISASFLEKDDQVSVATTKGKAIRFKSSDIRKMGRAAAGVRVIKLSKDDFVISADIIKKDAFDADILTISEAGYGKRTKIKEYKTQKRGGSGIKTAKVTAKTGNLIAAKIIENDYINDGELVAMSKKGQVIRLNLKEVPSLGRQTQGVRIMRLRDSDKIAALICL